MPLRKFLWIAWPAFLAACLLQLVVFAFVDPNELQWFHDTLAWSRQAVYSAAFFTFWCICMAACALTTLLSMTADDVNQAPFDRSRRAADGSEDGGELRES